MKEKMSKREGEGNSFSSFTKKYGIILVLIVLVVVAAIIQPRFLQPRNITNVLRQVAVNGVLAIGMTFVIISGGIDLSVGANFCLSGLVMMSLMPYLTWPGAIVVGLLLGTVVGFLNGYMVFRGMPAFIMTLAMSIILKGCSYILSNGSPVPSTSTTYNFIGQGYLFGIPLPVYIYAAVACFAAFIMVRTRFGRSVYSIGGNMEVARLSGINIRRIRIAVFMISGFLSALAAIIGTARLGSADPTLGEDYHSDAIAATVIGGTLMSGGEGHQFKTVVGVLILGVLSNVLNLMGVNPNMQYVVKGAIIVAAVASDVFSRNKKS
ncbi:MAG: ABC transporter permease [Oscillospiraceae bacterium]